MSRRTQTRFPSRIVVAATDTPANTELERSLVDLGYQVAGRGYNGLEAIKLTETTHPDVVLIDAGFRCHNNGISAADEIRRRWRIPIIFLAAAKQNAPQANTPEDLKATLLLALRQGRFARNHAEKHNWLSRILMGLTDGVIAATECGHIRFLNPAAEELTGWTSRDAFGKPLDSVYALTAFDGESIDSAGFGRPGSGGEDRVKRRYFLKRRGGDLLPIESTCATISESGRHTATVTVFSDITDRLRREREQNAERERLEGQIRTATVALGDTRAELRALSAHLMRGQEAERQRVARELHDDLGQRIAAIEFNVNQIQASAGELPRPLRDRLACIAGYTAELAESLRSVSHGLHSAVISDLGLETALRTLVDSHRQQGANVTAALRNVPHPVAFEVAVSMYRIVQEGLRNSLKHAAGAAVLVELAPRGKDLRLSISDNGPGFDLVRVRKRGGLGLLSIQERARLAGGTFMLRTAPGSGTSLIVKVPLETVQQEKTQANRLPHTFRQEPG